MPALQYAQALFLHAFSVLGLLSSKISMDSDPSSLDPDNAHPVVTDLTISFCSRSDPLSTCALDRKRWQRVEKDLYLHATPESAWLHVAQAQEKDLTADDLVVTDVQIGDRHDSYNFDLPWESRPGGIWVLRSKHTDAVNQAVTGVDVLFGTDTVDPRPQWTLMLPPLQLNASSEIPVPRLSVRHGRFKSPPTGHRPDLRVKENGKFKIVQVSDTHMVTGPGVCKDAIDAHGQPLPESEADPLTVSFISGILDIEKPDLVILAGDQVHHDVPDTQSALFKVVTPLIKRSIPYAAVFGNHDSEGTHALSRTAQMSLLHTLPFSLCQPGPKNLDGVGNYYLRVLDRTPSPNALITLYLLDSHGQIPSEVKDPDYDPIKQSQIDWFTNTSQALRKAREKDNNDKDRVHLSLAFMHIPLPEFGDDDLIMKGGRRREPTEGPSFNSHFYHALAQEGVAAVGCGHDHVNDFCALRPWQIPNGREGIGSETRRPGPWLCYGGGSGFGGYCSYGSKRYHRRMRVWEFDTGVGSLKTWKRVEYAGERVDELVLVERGRVVTSSEVLGKGAGDITDQAALS